MSVSLRSHAVELHEDLVVARLEGSLSLSESRSLYHQFELMLTERGYLLALFDLSKAAVPSPESRKWITDWFRSRDTSRIAVATFGTSLLVRTVNRMFDSTVSLLTGRAAPTRHFTHEAQARAWLRERKGRLRDGTKQ